MHLIHFSHFACPLKLVNRAVRYSFTCSAFGQASFKGQQGNREYNAIEVFDTFSQLELHLYVGKHTVSRLGQYDAIKRDWALKFSSIDTAGIECSSCSLDSSTPLTSPVDTSPHSSLRTGWAVSKPRGSVRFSEKVKEYLTRRISCVVHLCFLAAL